MTPPRFFFSSLSAFVFFDGALLPGGRDKGGLIDEWKDYCPGNIEGRTKELCAAAAAASVITASSRPLALMVGKRNPEHTARVTLVVPMMMPAAATAREKTASWEIAAGLSHGRRTRPSQLNLSLYLGRLWPSPRNQ